MLQDLLRSIGLDRFESIVLDGDDQLPALWDMKHPSGTTRMAADPSEGVVDVDCRVHGVEPEGDSGDLRLHYINEEGRQVEEYFDLVVLSVGLQIPDHLQKQPQEEP